MDRGIDIDMSIRIAVATQDGNKVFGGHFAHAKKFRIFELDPESKKFNELELRDNPLGNLPDFDDPHSAAEKFMELGIPLHGIPKYSWLKENVLNDVDVILCGGACQTSYQFFMSEGVIVVFDDPGKEIADSLKSLEKVIR